MNSALRVTAKVTLVGSEGAVAPGATASLPKADAEALIARGFAEAAPKRVAPSAPEREPDGDGA